MHPQEGIPQFARQYGTVEISSLSSTSQAPVDTQLSFVDINAKLIDEFPNLAKRRISKSDRLCVIFVILAFLVLLTSSIFMVHGMDPESFPLHF